MNATLPDASPLTDDLDDATIHEPMTKESDMNEARASERADLVAKPYAWLFEPHPIRLFFEAPRDPRGWLALYTEDALRAELSRASATAQEPADTRAVMEELKKLSSALIAGVCKSFVCEGGYNYAAEYEALESFVQHLASRASPSQPETPEAYNDYLEKCLEEFTDACIRGDASEVGEATDAIREFLSIDIDAITKGIAPSQPAEPAATASRTVSGEPARDEAALKVWLADHTSNGWVREGHLESLFAGMRLIPAQSVADPVKCGTCGDKKEIPRPGTTGHWLDRAINSQPCPDCTPASAEQKCVCDLPIHPICDRGYAENPQLNKGRCDNWMHSHGLHCGHAKACHAEPKP